MALHELIKHLVLELDEVGVGVLVDKVLLVLFVEDICHNSMAERNNFFVIEWEKEYRGREIW